MLRCLSARYKARLIQASLAFFVLCFGLSATYAQAQTRTSTLKSLLSTLSAKRAGNLRASFAYSPAFPTEGQAVQFADASTGSPRSWHWDFGDGRTSGERNPVHVYTASGFRKITLEVADSTTSKKAARTLTILPSASPATFVFSPATPGPGQNVQFADTTTGNPTSWQWNFGDGATSSVKNPRHVFNAQGSYTVSLTAVTSTATKQGAKTVTVANISVLSSSFTYSPALPTVGQTVQFTDTSAGSPTAWSWSFGDGSTSTAQNPSHSYATAGSKTVTLAVTNASGTNSTTRTVTVATALAASFSYAPTSPAVGQTVQFTDTSAGSPTAWSWSFGDGSTSTAQNPSHSYATAGSKTVTLAVTNASGTNGTTRTVTVATALAASFSYAPTSPAVGQTVQFTDTSAGSPTAWSWSFGDGSTSTAQNPSHSYATAGSKTVTLAVTNASGTNSTTRTVTVGVALGASFSYAPTSPAVGQTVQFTDTSAGSPTAWSWSFGDGSTSTAQNPSHSYATAGSKTVTLAVTNASGTNSTTRTVTVATALAASFSYAPTSPAVGQTVQFTDTSAGSPTAWSWSFGDGSTSTAQNPSHSYATAGSKTVTLAVTNASGTNSTTRTVTVGVALGASFSYAPTSPAVGQTVRFTDASTGSPTSWSWTFGDGSTSTAQNPSHSYATAGSKTVTLAVTNASGTNSTTRTVTVGVALGASFTYSPASPADGQAVQFTDTSTGNPTSWSWNFNDETTSTVQNPSHAFTAAGSYSVTLVVSTASTSSSTTRIITVTPRTSLTASFTHSPTSPRVDQLVQFTDTSIGSPAIWSWNFGDGATDIVQNPTHAYSTAGAKTVTLTVTNGSGSNSIVRTVTVSGTTPSDVFELPEDRSIDWSAAGVWSGSVKGIPTYPVGITINTVTPSHQYYCDPTGAVDCTAKLKAAISACPNGSAVYMPPGVYRVSSTVSWTQRSIALRGAGAALTSIKSYASSGDVIGLYGGSSSTSSAITGGLTHGSSTITVSSGSGFSAGDYVRFSEVNDSSVVHDLGSWMTRTIGQINQIQSTSGNQVTLVRPVYYTYNMSQSPTLYKMSPIVGSGVEDLSIEKVTAGNGDGCVHISRGANCWVKNVEVDKADYSHIRLFQSFRCEVRGCYLHHGHSYSSGRAYAVFPTELTSDCLIENNIMYYVRHHVSFEYGTQGNVVGYNYAARLFDDSYPDTDYLTEGINTHGGYPMFNLIEGNICSHIVLDDTWGGSLWMTIFRNHSMRYSEQYSGGNVLYNLNALEIQKYNYYANVIGNVLCRPGDTGVYETASYSTKAVYRFGNKDSSSSNPDPQSKSTAIIHGNYNYPLNSTDWNAVDTHSLPDSFYLREKPAWFGAMAWPAIGPDVSNYVQGIPAKARYDAYVASGKKADLFISN